MNWKYYRAIGYPDEVLRKKRTVLYILTFNGWERMPQSIAVRLQLQEITKSEAFLELI